jgi:salicylate hydroxylase
MLDRLERHFDALHWARTQDIAPLHRTLDDRVLLLGDAAHAVVQTLGQGATQAIEDGVVAANVVKSHPATLTELTRAYEAIRADRITFVRDFSREASDTLLPGGDPVSDTLKKAGAVFQAKLRRLYTDVS